MRALLRSLFSLLVREVLFPSSISSVMSTSFSRGIWDHRDQKRFGYRGRETRTPRKNFVTLAGAKVWVRVENSTSVVPSQSNNVMVEDIEREAFSEVSLEVRMEEVVSPSEEIPSMVKLDASKLGELTPLILEAENVVDGGYREDGSCANSTDDKTDVLGGEKIHDSRVESGHEVARKGEGIPPKMSHYWPFPLSLAAVTAVVCT